jgi:NADH dehydrogenase [ubiquinone] 1 alpha subcomplex assembly factor 1
MGYLYHKPKRGSNLECDTLNNSPHHGVLILMLYTRMNTIALLLPILIFQTTMTIFDFNPESDITNWQIVDDRVMGGRSIGSFTLSKGGLGVFEGDVSLENNGGFSMVQYRFEDKKADAFSKVCIRLKGDKKTYQFRVKTNASDSHSYVTAFDTNGEWQTIEIPFETLYPAFRGRTLDMANYPGQQLEMIAFLIGNKKAESFRLEIETIVLK